MTEAKDAGPSSASLYEMARREFGRAHLGTARALLDAFLEGNPDHAEAWRLLADTHLNEDREVAAIACLRRALAVEPGDIQTLRDLAVLYLEMGRFAEAVEPVRRASELAPSDPGLTYLLGVAWARNHQAKEALAAFSRVLADQDDHALAAFETAMILLGRGNYSAGWPHFERRHDLDPHHRVPVGPEAWTGPAAAGQQLLVTPEGGFGDMIWAARFLPAAEALGVKVTLMAPPGLGHLFSELEGVDRLVLDADNPGVDADIWCPILSLPARLGVTDPRAFPPARLHRRALPENRLEKLLARGAGRKRVGIQWSGSVTYGNNRHRAAALEDFFPLMESPEIQLYALQKGAPQGDLDECGVGNLIIETDDFDFAETAALVDNLDLIIMTDSALAHIAGSLNRPVWVLLDANPYWYHGMQGDRSPWYPSMRFFRQAKPGDWAGVMAEVVAALEAFDPPEGSNPIQQA